MKAGKIISYVFPTTIESGRTSLGQVYEVNLENGSKVLNSENANYSFGSLHRIMQKGISEVLRENKPSRILMLGLGGGSALQILKNKCHWAYHVTAIEIDKDLVALSRKHFGLDAYPNLRIMEGDAMDIIGELPDAGFDYILDDIFWDNTIPDFCATSAYLEQNRRLLASGGVYMRNTMPDKAFDSGQFEALLNGCFGDFYAITDREFGNRIYFCRQT